MVSRRPDHRAGHHEPSARSGRLPAIWSAEGGDVPQPWRRALPVCSRLGSHDRVPRPCRADNGGRLSRHECTAQPKVAAAIGNMGNLTRRPGLHHLDSNGVTCISAVQSGSGGHVQACQGAVCRLPGRQLHHPRAPLSGDRAAELPARHPFGHVRGGILIPVLLIVTLHVDRHRAADGATMRCMTRT